MTPSVRGPAGGSKRQDFQTDPLPNWEGIVGGNSPRYARCCPRWWMRRSGGLNSYEPANLRPKYDQISSSTTMRLRIRGMKGMALRLDPTIQLCSGTDVGDVKTASNSLEHHVQVEPDIYLRLHGEMP